MTSLHTGSSFAAIVLGALMNALTLLILSTNTVAQAGEQTWTVDCGLPLEEDPLLELLPTGGYTGPWRGDPRKGHVEVKSLHRNNPEGGITTEMWLLSRSVGWWRLKAIWMHPDDLPDEVPDMIDSLVGGLGGSERRQIIDSPFLLQPVVVRAGNPDDEELVNGQILALLPDASQLRCSPQPERTE